MQNQAMLMSEKYVYLLIDFSMLFDRKNEIKSLLPKGQRVSLFEGSLEEELEDIAPWLYEISNLAYFGSEQYKEIAQLELEEGCLSWVQTNSTISVLQQHLCLFLNSRLKSGAQVLVRFYDPSVLLKLNKIYTEDQWNSLFSIIKYWYVWDANINQRVVLSKKDIVIEADYYDGIK